MTSRPSLNPKQELFCKLYATDKEFFANGVQTYIEVYKPDQDKKNWYKTACASAAQLLANIKVCERINQLLEEGGLNDQFVDKQLKFLVTQHADYKSKLGAIKEYNALKARVTKKLDVMSGGEKLESNVIASPELVTDFVEFMKAKKDNGHQGATKD